MRDKSRVREFPTIFVVGTGQSSLLISLVFSSLLVLLVYFQLPVALNVDVEPVGRPIYTTYNIQFRYYVYYLMGAFPFLVVASWYVLRRWLNEASAVAETSTAAEKKVALPIAARWRETIAMVTALMLPASVWLLWLASSATKVNVWRTSQSVHYSWFPMGSCALCFVVAEGLVVWLLYRNRLKQVSFRNTERTMFWWLAVPVFIFLSHSYTQGPMRDVEYIHEVEAPVAAQSVLNGGFPWRDCMTTAGIFHGLIRGLVGLGLFENSTWGVEAAHHLIFEPAYWVLTYFFFLLLFGGGAFLLLMFFVLPFSVPILFGHSFVRLCLYPVALALALTAFRTRPFCVAFYSS